MYRTHWAASEPSVVDCFAATYRAPALQRRTMAQGCLALNPALDAPQRAGGENARARLRRTCPFHKSAPRQRCAMMCLELIGRVASATVAREG